MKPTIKPLEKSRVEITATIPAEKFESYRARALEAIGKEVKIDGFRPGHVPASVIEKNVKEVAILEEMAQRAILDTYPTILADHNIDAIGRPEITLTKLAAGNDLSFTITTAVLPEIKLADYKKISKSHTGKSAEVTLDESEVESAITELRQLRAHQQLHDDRVEHHDHDHTKIDDKDLPELTDEFVQSLGKFEGIEDFKTKLRENLLKEKQNKEVEKKRIAIIDEVIEQSTIDLPDMLVDFELDKMMQQFVHDISMMGMTIEDYLKRIEKTEAVLKVEWRDNAVKRAKMQMILDRIAEVEKLVPTEAEILAETTKILDMYKDQADLSEDRARAYVTQILTNAKAFDFLEGGTA